MKTRTKTIVKYIILSITVFFLGDLISPFTRMIKLSKKNFPERTIQKNVYSNNSQDGEHDLTCKFLSKESFLQFFLDLNFDEKHVNDFEDYIEKHARKANFIDPKIKEYLIQNNYSFAMPYNLNQQWGGKFYFNDNGNIKVFPPNIFGKGEYLENNPSKSVYYYFSRNDFIDYLVCSGMTSKSAIEFEKKLQKPVFSRESEKYGIEDSTLPESTRHIMKMMEFNYSIPVVNGIWNGILNIKRENTIYTINSQMFKYYTDYFHYEINVPIDVAGTIYNYILYDYNWEIFSKTFFGSYTIAGIINEIKNTYTQDKMNENTNLCAGVKEKMIKGNYMFSEPYFPETNKWLGIRNVMINNKFYILAYN